MDEKGKAKKVRPNYSGLHQVLYFKNIGYKTNLRKLVGRTENNGQSLIENRYDRYCEIKWQKIILFHLFPTVFRASNATHM